MQSPSLNQSTRDLCFHVAASLSSQQLSSTLVSLMFFITSELVGCISNHSKSFCSGAISCPTCLKAPNTSRFHACNLVLHEFKHDRKGCEEMATNPAFHASDTISSHLESFNHMDSNLKHLLDLTLFRSATNYRIRGL